jgi:copper chaperone CopZ
MSHVKGRLLRWAVIAGFLLGALLVASAEAQRHAEPEAQRDAEPNLQDVTLKLGGPSCEDHIEGVEAVLLRVRGVATVNIEKKKGQVVVGFDPSRVSLPELLQAVGKARGDNWSCAAQLAGGS